MGSRVFLSPEKELFSVKTHIIHALAETTSEAYLSHGSDFANHITPALCFISLQKLLLLYVFFIILFLVEVCSILDLWRYYCVHKTCQRTHDAIMTQ